MKKMTCRQMGGPCDEEFTGDLEKIIADGSVHVTAMAATDPAHAEALKMMEDAQKDPKLAEDWYKQVSEVFASMQTV